MKVFISCISFLFIASAVFGKITLPIDEIHERVKKDLNLATNCLPSFKANSIELCTGVTLSRKDIEKIEKKGLSYCIPLIEENGYRVVFEGQENQVKKELWDSFYKTTKWAESLHREKLVFMKKIASKVDCLHELIHTLQWTAVNSNPFSPIQRNQLYENFEKLLLDFNKQIFKLEKEKKIDKARGLGQKAKRYINTLKEYSLISQWLDEKDVYYTFYKICNKELSCSKKDWNTIIGNLLKMQTKFPWKFRNEIINRGSRIVKEKENRYLGKVKYKSLKPDDYFMIDKLLKKSWRELIDFIKSKNIKVYQLKMSKQTTSLQNTGLIPYSELSLLPKPTHLDLVALLSYSKINPNYVLGKFLCTLKGKNKKNFVIITNKTSKGILIHEFIHYLQSLHNPTYCDAITTQNNIAIKFKTGKITREEYEDKILTYKIFIRKTEEEVYKYMGHRKEFSEFEINNYKVQYLIYKSMLTKGHSNNKRVVLPKKIKFNVIDHLPLINVLGGHLVLDLGAMDSVIKPQLVFKHFDFNRVKTTRIKTLQNALGKKTNAPQIIITGNININNESVQNSKWILADLKLPTLDGVLGLSFFKNENFIIYPQKGIIKIINHLDKPKEAFPIQRDYDGSIKAIEFICPTGLTVRLDSGSQVEGDLSSKINEDIIDSIKGKKYLRCGKLKINGNFHSNLQNKVIFGRGVDLNVGWPWISKYKVIKISLRDAWIAFGK